MKHKQKYYDVLGFVLVIIGVAIIGGGLWYGYGVFSGRVNLPMVFENPGTAASAVQRTLSITNPATGKTVIDLPVDVNQKVGRGGDITVQYLFVLLLIMGGGKMAKLGIDLLKIPASKVE